MSPRRTSSAVSLLTLTTCVATVVGSAAQAQKPNPWWSFGGSNEQDLGHYFKQVQTLTASAALPSLKSRDSGALHAVDAKGKSLGTCALKHTDVSVHISGYMASVDVKQSFHNPFSKKIEAVYTFPLSDSAAVDDMTMRVGSRLIHGTIKKKQEAHQIYEAARENGEVASVLDQERSNVFRESVANIDPGKDIDVTVHYVDLLPFESGSYSFVFPTVVGPRFNPSAPEQTNPNEGHFAQASVSAGHNSAATGGAAFVNPLITPEGTRSGHDISISLDLDAGLPVDSVCCPLHAVKINPLSPTQAHIELVNQQSIPNKDFVFSWNVGGDAVKSGYLTHKTGKSGFLTMMLVPPKQVTSATAAPKEMVFMIDRSGSQDGPPLDKAKETMLYILQHINPGDTFQIMSFADNVEVLFDKPKQINAFTKARAEAYIQHLTADGGTWMGPAVKKICEAPEDQHRLRVVTFMTDGEIGNDEEILGLIRKYRGKSRWFSFGTGDSVNRFLIDGIAREGGGEPDYVLLNRPGAEVAEHFYKLISSPVLTDIHVDFTGVEVEDVLPRQVSDVWAERPVYIKARYTKGGSGVAHLHGFAGGKPYNQDISISLPDVQPAHSEIAQIWARSAVDELMALDWFGANDGAFDKKLKDQVVDLALKFHIMTQFTSFVAVDEKSKTSQGMPVQTEVPVDMPEGVSLKGLFSEGDHAFEQMMRGRLIEDTNSTINVWQAPQLSNSNSATSTIPSNTSSTSVAPVSNTSSSSFPFGSWGSISEWFENSARDANLFGGDTENESSFKKASWFKAPMAVQVTDIEFPDVHEFRQSSGGSSYSSNAGLYLGTTTPVSGKLHAQAKARSSPMPTAVAMPTARRQAMLPSPAPTPVSAIGTKSMTAIGKAGSRSGAPAQMAAPALQGATNGAIGPQGFDATEITGVNTAGIVRSSNLSRFAAYLQLAKLLDFGTLALGLFFIVKGLVGIKTKRAGSWKPIVFGVTWIVVGFTFCLALIPWTILLGCTQLWRRLRSARASRVSTALPASPAQVP